MTEQRHDLKPTNANSCTVFRILGQLAYSLVVPLYRQVPNSDISNDSERGERERGRGGRGRKTEGGGREREERAGGIERGGKTKRERGEGGGGGRERERESLNVAATTAYSLHCCLTLSWPKFCAFLL